MTGSNEEVRPDFWACVNLIDRWYRDGVAEVADEYMAQTEQRISVLREDGNDPDFDEEEAADEVREEMETWLHETLDGHEFIIYTMKANAVLMVSNNDDAYEQEIGGYGKMETRAFFAMRQDVAERIEL